MTREEILKRIQELKLDKNIEKALLNIINRQDIAIDELLSRVSNILKLSADLDDYEAFISKLNIDMDHPFYRILKETKKKLIFIISNEDQSWDQHEIEKLQTLINQALITASQNH